jgi:glycyl-tRNA synthetase beta chain
MRSYFKVSYSMASELLLELFYEEIPALMQQGAEIGYKEIFAKILQKHHIEFDELEVFVTPRRIALYAGGVNSTVPAQNIEFKGPSVSAPKQAIEGFCKGHNVGPEDLSQKLVKNQNFYFHTKTLKEQKTSDLLIDILPSAIKEYVWPKSMYWGDYDLQSVRPLKNILCLFDGKVLQFKFGHLTANDITGGHRFIGKQNLKIRNFAEYQHILKENYVILSRAQRKNEIKSQMEKISTEYNLKLKEDERLLEEVAGLVEYPVVLIGEIDKKFLKLPKEVLVSSIRTHQKYFNLFEQTGDFAPYFLFVSNLKSSTPEIIIDGNQRVLSARLADALYFYEQDSKRSLEGNNEALKSMMFHAKLGSMEEKIHRIAKICHYLDPENIELQLAARVCKSDLVSSVVSEFPELQGIMGYYYALNEDLSEEVARAIYDHYKPLGPDSPAPTGSAGLLAIADKIDSLVGLMLAGEAPTGSKDPYALRRTALGIIRIILENHLQINLKELVEFTSDLYLAVNLKNGNPELDSGSRLPYEIPDRVRDDGDATGNILDFINERAKHHFKNEYDHNLIQASIDLTKEHNIVTSYHTLRALNDFLRSSKGEDCLAAYKRVNNIIGKHNLVGDIKTELFTSYEKNLASALRDVQKQINIAWGLKHYEQALNCLWQLLAPINDFFDNVMVMDEDRDLANNRLLLMLEIKNTFDKIAKFDLL